MWQGRLQKHLETCENRPKPKPLPAPLPVFIRPGVNNPQQGESSLQSSESEQVRVADITPEEALAISQKIDRCHLIQPPVEPLLDPHFHSMFPSSSDDPQYLRKGERSGYRHAAQESSMVAHATRAGVLPVGSRVGATLVEFGCGTARLSQYFQRALNGDADVVLVDRQEFKKHRRKDHAIATTAHGKGRSFLRVTADIRDLDLNSIPVLRPPVVCIGKHLCGVATDYTLQSLSSYAASLSQETLEKSTNTLSASEQLANLISWVEGGESSEPTAKSISVCVATCCHYLCNWDAYVNLSLFQGLGFSRREFAMLCALSSWATLGEKSPSNENSEASEDESDSKLAKLTFASDQHEIGSGSWSVDTKRALGAKCKLLLDHGRKLFLESRGFSTQLVKYTRFSKENTLLLATFRPHRSQ